MADRPQRGNAELAGAALRLHNGPLQCMFAGIMLLEGANDASSARAIEVLRDGARDLTDIISALDSMDAQVTAERSDDH